MEKGGRIIKVAAKQRIDLEWLFYRTLRENGVATIENDRVHACVLLLEDLAVSADWRLANEADIAKATIGEACAKWCQAFHGAGRLALTKEPTLRQTLRWEYDAINECSLDWAGQALALANRAVWGQACEIAERLVALVRPRVNTFTYNDFHYVNLAVAKRDESVISLFDFDHSGKGFAESDYRNVASGLCGEALRRFKEEMSPDPLLWAIDAILSTLYGLIEASRRDKIPVWAGEMIEDLKTAEFAAALKRVVPVF